MRSYRNPFRSRTSEQQSQQGLQRFLRTYSAEALDLLPEQIWDRPVVIASAPGAGKTSLLRAFTADTLREVADHPHDYEELAHRLTEMEVLAEGAPAVLGFRVPLTRDFRAIVDLEVEPVGAHRVFLRLLDARAMRAFLEAAQVHARKSGALESLTLIPSPAGEEALRRLGGPTGQGLLEHSVAVEREILDRLDAVLPPPDDTSVSGHGALYCFRALSGVELRLGGRQVPARILVMLDDGHELARSQRDALLDAMHDRELGLARWYTERYSAMDPEELVGDGEVHRGTTRVWLEREALRLGAVSRRGNRTRRFERLLGDVANRRAMRALQQYADEDRSFIELLDTTEEPHLDGQVTAAVEIVRNRVIDLAEHGGRYREWISQAQALHGLQALQRWRELEIVIQRDRGRPAMGLFDLPLTDQERRERSSSAIREAADLFLRREFGIPFYSGPERLAKLAAENIEQYLGLCGELFDEMLVQITLREPVRLSRLRQDRAVTVASETFWRAIPQRRSGGRAIQRLLKHIAHLCRKDTYRPKAPYAPGVTGTALSMRDRDRLLDQEVRSRLEGAQDLFDALAGAIGHNLLRAETDRPVKNDRWMVLSLNRLICARYGLPLGYGGFRERSLEEMCEWMLADVEEESAQEVLDVP